MHDIEPEITDQLTRLERRLQALLQHCRSLQEENGRLRASLQAQGAERAELVQETAIAKNRVAAMISRLKSMGHET